MNAVKKAVAGIAVGLLMSGSVFALPILQLDIEGGVYDITTQTIMTEEDEFTVYALFNMGSESNKNPMLTLESTINLVIALTPPVMESDPAPNLGSFTIDDGAMTTINVASDMEYGTPPTPPPEDPDLPPHGIYPTYYYEQEVQFTEDMKAVPYNTQDDFGGFMNGGLVDTGEGSFYYMPFDINMEDIPDGYGLHFYLYTMTMDDRGKEKIIFAPFSHDAGTRVPEPTTASLLLLSLFSFAAYRRKR